MKPIPRFAVLLAALVGCGEVTPASTPQAASAQTEKTRAEILADFNSTEEHWATLKSVGDNMLVLGYAIDEKGTKLEPKFVTGHLAAHAFHIHAPDVEPYKMEWRLAGTGGMGGGNDVPVSFLITTHEGPFDHDVAVATVKEFQRAAAHALDLSSVKAAMKDAEAKYAKQRKKPADDIGPGWLIVSKNVKQDDYAYRVDIQEWVAEEYTRENGLCKVTVYAVYLPPGKKVDLKEVSGGGFGFRGR